MRLPGWLAAIAALPVVGALAGGCGGAFTRPAITSGQVTPQAASAPVAARPPRLGGKLPAGSRIDSFRNTDFGNLKCLALSPDNRFVAASGWDTQSVEVWDVTAGAVMERFEEAGGSVRCAFFRDGTLATVSENGLLLRSLDSGGVVAETRASETLLLPSMALDVHQQLYISDLRRIMRYEPHGGLKLVAHFDESQVPLLHRFSVVDGVLVVFRNEGKATFFRGAQPVAVMSGVTPWAIPIAEDAIVDSGEDGIVLRRTDGSSVTLRDTSRDKTLWYHTIDWDPISRNVVAANGQRVERFRVDAPDRGCTLALPLSGRVVFGATGDAFVVATATGEIVIARASDCREVARVQAFETQTEAVAVNDAGALVATSDGVVEWLHEGAVQTRVLDLPATITGALALDEQGTWLALLGEAQYAQRLAVISGEGSTGIALPPLGTSEIVRPGKRGVFVGSSTTAAWVGLDGTYRAASLDRSPYSVGYYCAGSETGSYGRDGERLVWYPFADGSEPVAWEDAPDTLGISPDGNRGVTWTWSEGQPGPLQWRELPSGKVLGGIPSELTAKDVVPSIRVAPDKIWLLAFHPSDSRFIPGWPPRGVELRSLSHDGTTWDPPLSFGDDIVSFEVSPSGRWLIARTRRGFVHVVDTSTKPPVTTELATFQDGSWMSLRSTGEYAASDGLARRALVRIGSGKLRRPVEPLPDGFLGEISSLPYPGGALLKAWVRSAAGAPEVRLGPARIRNVRQSTYFADVYEVSTFIENGRLGSLDLKLKSLEGTRAAPSTHAFDVRQAKKRTLLVANETYAPDSGLRTATGAIDDANKLARLLQRSDSWASPPITPQTNVKTDAMRTQVQGFLLNASGDESLLLYYNGHADKALLLGTDFNPSTRRGISGDELAQWLLDSPAREVVVLIDACHGGTFIAPELRETTKRRAIYATSSAQGKALGGARSFTSTMLGKLPGSATAPVSLRRAFFDAAGDVTQQPTVMDPFGLGEMPLLLPVSTPVAASRSSRPVTISRIEASDTKSAVTNDISVFNDLLTIDLLLGSTAEGLALYLSDAAGHSADASKWPPQPYQAGSRITWSVPIGQLPAGKYAVEVWPCSRATCDDGPPATGTFTKQ